VDVSIPLSAFFLGIALGTSPGPVQLLLFSEASRGGVGRGLRAMAGANGTFGVMLLLLAAGLSSLEPGPTFLRTVRVIGGAFLAMASHGADQIIVQRLLSSRSLRQAQVAIIGSGIAVFAQMTLFLFVGLGLWVVYNGQTFAAADQIFPTFIIERMPHGLIGLIVAAIIAATMSTHSGAINALAASSTYDIYLPFTGR